MSMVAQSGQRTLRVNLDRLLLIIARLHRPVHYIRDPRGHVRNVGDRRHMPAEHRLVLAVAVVEWRTERATGNVGLLARASAKPTPYFECSKCFFELLRLTKTDPY